MKIPTEDFTDETLAIDDTQGDDVRGGDWVLVMEVDKVANEVTHGSRQGDQHSEDIFLI